jgi:hypothetical protein
MAKKETKNETEEKPKGFEPLSKPVSRCSSDTNNSIKPLLVFIFILFIVFSIYSYFKKGDSTTDIDNIKSNTVSLTGFEKVEERIIQNGYMKLGEYVITNHEYGPVNIIIPDEYTEFQYITYDELGVRNRAGAEFHLGTGVRGNKTARFGYSEANKVLDVKLWNSEQTKGTLYMYVR